MQLLLAWWHEFAERYDDYTHADDLRYPDADMLSAIQEVATQNSIPTRQVANNDEMISYVTYVIGAKIALELVKYSNWYLQGEARKIVEKTSKLYEEASRGSVSRLVDGTINNIRWSDRIWANMDALQSDVRAIMKRALLSHDNPVTQTKYIRDKFKSSYNEARRLLMTESARIMSEETVRAAKEAGYSRLKWVANTGACKECAPLDGKTFTLRDADRMQPKHPYCMCSWVGTDEI